jgi:adenylate kinase family enzyme
LIPSLALVSPGVLLRAMVADADTPPQLAAAITAAIDTGGLVADEIVSAVVRKRLVNTGFCFVLLCVCYSVFCSLLFAVVCSTKSSAPLCGNDW